MRESTVEKYLCEQVRKHGGWCEKHVCPGQRGVPDRIVAWNYVGARPEVHWIETKAPDGDVKSHQSRDHLRRVGFGFEVYVLYTKADVDRYIASVC
jgi:hypothetical protein